MPSRGSRAILLSILLVLAFVGSWKLRNPLPRALRPFSECTHDNVRVTPLHLARASRMANFVEGPGLALWHTDDTTAAACKFRKSSSREERHFPHAMQQLYRCFSWWHANPNKDPVLLWTTPHESQFVQGFVDLLKHASKNPLQAVTQRNGGLQPVRPIVDYEFSGDSFHGGFRMRSSADMEHLRQIALEVYDTTTTSIAGCPPPLPPGQPRHDGSAGIPLPQPVLTILNRPEQSGRHLEQTEALKTFLETHAGLDLKSVQVVDYQEDTDFQQQVRVMQQTDILLSPHGSQWTASAFLPRCSHTMEIFPPGYETPHFYGSLSAVSGHNYWKVGDGSNHLMGDADTRKEAKAQNVCLSSNVLTDELVPALQQAIREWQHCCGHGKFPGQRKSIPPKQ